MGEPCFVLADCLQRARAGDGEAARRLVEHLYPQVMRIIATKLPRRESAEDLAQDIFLKMFTKLEQYKGNVPFDHWVSRIAVNHCLNTKQTQQTQPKKHKTKHTPEQTETHNAVLT